MLTTLPYASCKAAGFRASAFFRLLFGVAIDVDPINGSAQADEPNPDDQYG